MMSRLKQELAGYVNLAKKEQQKAVFKLNLRWVHQRKKVSYALYVIL